MGELRQALEDALSGQGRLFLLAGDPGIGKTRTAQELARSAAESGMLPTWGRCYDGEGAPPYWPWIQVLRAFLRQTGPEQLSLLVGPGAADIGELVPEVREKLPELGPPAPLEPDQARFRLFDSIGRFFKNVARDQPLMLILDDLHWADRPSLMLLEFLSQELAESPVIIVGTYRDIAVTRGDPLHQTLGNIHRQPSFRRLALPGLSQPEVEELLAVAASVIPSPQMVEAIHLKTEGNPLFVGEIMRMLDREGLLGGAARSFSIPQGVRETIGRRLASLSQLCYQSLVTASVIGREFDFSLLGSVIPGTTEEQLLLVIDEAREARLIEEISGVEERYQFSHALIQDTFFQELSVSRRVRLHARVGETLENRYGANAHLHAGELAFHFNQAQAVVGEQRLVRYSLLAGEQALAAYACQEALEHFQRALAAKQGKPMDYETAAILSGLGRAQAATLERHRIPEVVATLSLAVDYFAEVGDVAQITRIAELSFYPVFGQSTGNIRLIELALSQVPADSREAGRLLARYAWVLATEEGDYQLAQQSFERALAIARLQEDPGLEMKTLAQSANVDMLHLEFQSSVEKGRRALDLAPNIDEPESEAIARYSMFLSYLALGDLEAMKVQVPHLFALAERLRDRFWMTLALRSYEDCARLAGDWSAAQSYSDRGLALSPGEARSLCTRTLIESQIGDFAAGEAYAQRLLEVMRQTPPGPTLEHAFTAMTLPLLSRISGNTQLLEPARAASQVTLASRTRIGNLEWSARAGLALIAEQTKDAGLAGEQYANLLPTRGTALPFSMLSVDRVLGLLSQTRGDLDRAVAHFEDARAFCQRAGYIPELGWVCSDFAQALVRRGGAGDKPRARDLLEEALNIASRLEMPPLRAIARGHLESLQAIPAASAAYPAGLSRREVEVLRLVAAGRSNREIARELFISLNTVANHVRSILTKTDTANRTEAAAYAHRVNLHARPDARSFSAGDISAGSL
jgi:DNA-binding CsgD family transcriptional regulator/Tfp pilus assembly protein PilF